MRYETINEGAIEQARQSGHTARLADELYNAARIAFMTNKDYPMAVSFYHEALRLYDQQHRWSIAAIICVILGGLARHAGNTDDALLMARERDRYDALAKGVS